jgi:uncharacterized protein YndB with AHSA1/START domain
MTKISDRMSAITIDRMFGQPPAKVFAAFAQKEQKAQWFAGPTDGSEVERVLDCRTGGREVLEVRWPSGTVTRFEAKYHHVEAEGRLVYGYDLFIDGALYSVSLADIVFEGREGGTAMRFAETTSYFSDQELGEVTASRMHGTSAQMDMLAMHLSGETVTRTIDDCH